jgi:ABC-2 type transport system permease protein
MFNRYIINFVLLFKPVFARFGVNPDQLRIILTTKMMMDDRRPNVYNQQRQKKKKEVNHSSWITMLFLGLTGIFFTTLLVIPKQPFVGHTIYFSAFMIILAITLISDFTSVLIDVRDNYIILPRPVSDSTFTVSRILHIGIHTSKMVLAISLSGMIYSFIWQGPIVGLVFILEAFIATVLSIFLVNIIYLIVLKLTSPQKFKDFISYFQIIFSVLIFAAYYTLPRLMNASILGNFNIKDIKILSILPPLWIAALHEMAVNFKSTDILTVVYVVIALISPVVSLYLVVKVLAPGFNQKLSSISGSGEDGNVISTEGKGASKGFMNILAKKLAPDPIENAGFKLTWLLSSRYRDFKVKVFPSFAYVPVYFVYFGFINKKGNMGDSWQSLLSGDMYILLMYLTSFVLTTVLQHVSVTERYKASWIFFTTPYQQPGKILAGMFKAVIIKYYVPYFMAISIFSLVFWGPKVINDLILAFMVGIIYGLLVALFQVKGLPFSQPINLKKGGKTFATFFIIIVPLGIGFLHHWAAQWETAIWISAIIMTFFAWLAFNSYKKETWESIQMAD